MNIHIRDVEDELHAALAQRAKDRGLSLSEFLRQELSHLAKRLTAIEALEQLHKLRRPHVSREAIRRAIVESREERDGDRGTQEYPQGLHETQSPLKT